MHTACSVIDIHRGRNTLPTLLLSATALQPLYDAASGILHTSGLQRRAPCTLLATSSLSTALETLLY